MYPDHTKKKWVLYVESMNEIVVALDRQTQAINELKTVIVNKPNDMSAQAVVASLAPLAELARTAGPFLKEIISNEFISNEFISAVTSKNTDLAKRNTELEDEVSALRERLSLVLQDEDIPAAPAAVDSPSPPF